MEVESGEGVSRRMRWHLLFVSVTYILTIGVSGLVLCAIGSNLTAIARRVDMKDTVLGGRAFMCRGVGAIAGAVSSAWLYKSYSGDVILVFGLIGIASLLTIIPFSKHAFQVYFYFMCLGICSAINDTGCNIMMRKLHGKQAGPWLGANGISFGMAAAIVPLVELLTSDLTEQYHTLAVLVLLIAAMMMYGITEKEGLEEAQQTAILQKEKELEELVKKHPLVDSLVPHYHVETAVAFMVFCFVGGQVDTVAYMASYLDQTNVIAMPNRGKVLLVFWAFVSIGRFLGVIDQRYLTDETLVLHLSFCCALGSLLLLPLICFRMSSLFFWASIACYALLYGPTVAYCHDLNNRLTLPTEQSTSIVMFGINCGASFVPFLTSHFWESYQSPLTFPLFILLSMFLPLPLALLSRSLSYKSELPEFETKRPLTFFEYHSLSTRKFKAAADAIIALRRMSLLSRSSQDVDTSYAAIKSGDASEAL